VVYEIRTPRAGTVILGGLLVAVAAGVVSCRPTGMTDCPEAGRPPGLSPDYAGCVIPANIAPLNFRIREEGRAYFATIRSDRGRPIHVSSRTGQIRIPAGPWRALLDANRGREILFEVCVRGEDRQWRRFRPVANTIAPEDIDGTLVFRFMKPLYNWWRDIGIYQRDLAGYGASLLLHGRSFGGGCLNCHSFVGNDPETMTIALRSATYGSHTLLARGGAVEKIGAKWGYTAWHPSGTLAVYSINKVTQFFQAGGLEVRDVVDLDSALVCYRIAGTKARVAGVPPARVEGVPPSNRGPEALATRGRDARDTEEARHMATVPKELADKDRLETYPAWSPDGKYLYYCSAPILWKDRDAVPPENYDKVKYDLRRIPYDVATNTWGESETVLSAAETGLSILLPRVSPDGRFLLFCMCRYGCFPVYQPSSDLYLMDLATRQYRKLAINSEFSESWHSWSGNSRWIAFSSKRQDGLFTRTYLSYVDEAGTVHKPFILPQRDPAHYDALLETYSMPELVKGPVRVSRARLARAARARPSVMPEIPITGASPKAPPVDPWQERE